MVEFVFHMLVVRRSIAEATPTLIGMQTFVFDVISIKERAHRGYIYAAQVSPDGTMIASGSSNKTIKVWDSGAF